MPDFGEDEDDEEPKPLAANDVPTKQVHLLAPIPSESKLERVETATSFVQPTEGDEGHVESWDSKLTYILATVGYAVGLGNFYVILRPFFVKVYYFHFRKFEAITKE